MRNGKATLRDVAEQAGVNTATVSVVLNGSRSGTGVSKATRQRIMDSARELRYQPNAVARSLKRSRTNIIGFYLGGSIPIDDPFFVEVHCGLERGCMESGQHLLIYSRLGTASIDDAYAELTNGTVSGLVVYAQPDDALSQRLAESHLPLVAIADAIPNIPSVIADAAAGGRLQAEHLAAKGHRRVLYRHSQFSLASASRQFAGFSKAAADLGLTVLESQVPRIGGVSDEEGQILALPAEQRPTAVACWNDYYAYELLNYFHTHRIQTPDDLAVIGYDGIRVGFTAMAWDLTTISVPWRDIAATAVSLLLSAMNGTEIPRETILPVSLYPGQTV